MPTPQILDIPLDRIRAGDNDRTVFRESDLRALADSLAKDGLLQPVTLRSVGDHYEIVAGERRTRAALLLGWTYIPAIVREMTDEQASSAMLAENIHRADIDPLDEARAYQKRIDSFGWSPAQVAKAAKVGEKRVRARLALLTLVPEAQHLIRSGQMGVQFGEIMASLDHNRQRIAMRYLSGTDHPLLREFAAVVGKLTSEQAQDTMFDLNLFVAQALEEHAAERAEWKDRRFPFDERLPLMKRVGTLGLSFETYIATLLASDDQHHRDAAPIVGRVYQSMLLGGMAYPPRRERHSPLESLKHETPSA